jgi:two-component system, NarL family, response regulator DevR
VPWPLFRACRRRWSERSPRFLDPANGRDVPLLALPLSEVVAASTQARQTELVKTRVFLLDDHEIVRVGLTELINAEIDMEVVGEAGTAAEAVGRIGATTPDVAVLDYQLPDGNGVEVCREVRDQYPNIACLMLTAFSDDDALFSAIMAGARGYVLKQVRGNDLVDSIRRVARGEQLLDPTLTARVLDRLRTPPKEEIDPLASLSMQEKQILTLISDGLTNRQISEKMFLAEKTVKNYVSSVLTKLGMERRTEAAVFAARLADRAEH